jgi:hypothetical protein
VSDIRSTDLTSCIHACTVGYFRSTWQLGSRARSGKADYRVDTVTGKRLRDNGNCKGVTVLAIGTAKLPTSSLGWK